MKVVIDSNIIISDFWMESIPSKMLLENSKNSQIDLYIPKVVLDEVCNKYNERIKSNLSNISREVKSFEKLSKQKTAISISKETEDKIFEDYKAYLSKTINENNIKILEYPNTSHEYLAKKAMLKKKPFNENEKGYRDNLIWENIKSLISNEDIEIPATPELIFITKNHKDFTENNNIHSDLIEDLENQSLNSESFEIIETLSEFKDKFLNYYFIHSEAFKNKLVKNEFWDFTITPAVFKFLKEKFEGNYIYNYYSFAPLSNDDPTVSYINEEFELSKLEVKKINSQEYLVDLIMNIDVDIEYYVDKSDYWSTNETTFSIIDLDWNDHVIAVSDTVNIAFEVSLLIDNELNIETIELLKINDDYE
ncbi:PIN domain-containing protein [Soonwooa purpurea]